MTATPLRTKVCREQKTHLTVWYGMALCCLHEYSPAERQVKPRSYTLPVDQLHKVA